MKREILGPSFLYKVLIPSFFFFLSHRLFYEDFILKLKWMNAKVFMTLMPLELDHC